MPMATGEAAKVFQAQGVNACIDCKHSMLPYKLDDFHMNAQCWSHKNRTIKVSPVTLQEYPEYKQQFCKDTRSDASLCGPKGDWFEPVITESLGAATEVSKGADESSREHAAESTETPS